MAERLPPGALRRWRAFERLEPDPLELIAEILKLGFAALSMGARVKPEDLDPRSAEGDELSPSAAAKAYVAARQRTAP